MRTLCVSLLGLMLIANADHNASDQKALTDTIESTVQLPEGALPLSDYSRNYAYMRDGNIKAIFVPPYEPIMD